MPSSAAMQDEIDRLQRQISQLEQDEINRLRRQISQLEQAERGGASSESLKSTSSTTFTDESDEPGIPPSTRKNKKYVAIVVGIAMLIGIVAALAALRDFLKKGDIQFVQDEPGTALISVEELALHSTPDDCWVVYYEDVYDLTNYARRHPGGESFVTDSCGADGTVEYEVFHSKSLLRSVQGEIVGSMSTSAPASGGGTFNGQANGSGSEPVDCSESPNCVSIEELAKHNTADDCWIAVNGQVYDWTEYAKRHPGGARVVTDLAGTDGTNEYLRFHSYGLLGGVRGTLIGPYEGGVEMIDPNNQGGGSSPDSSD